MLLKPIKAVLLAAALLLPAFTYWLARELTTPFGRGRAAVYFEVEKGRSAGGVVRGLRERGLVRSALPLGLACRFFYSTEQFKAGEYLISPPLRPKDALFLVFQGRIHLQPVTVPEGLTGREIAKLLRPGDPEGAAAFERAFRDPGPVADLDQRARDLEGYLFPDTYRLPRKATEAELVAAMVAGYAVYGCYPEYRDLYALHVFFDNIHETKKPMDTLLEQWAGSSTRSRSPPRA